MATERDHDLNEILARVGNGLGTHEDEKELIGFINYMAEKLAELMAECAVINDLNDYYFEEIQRLEDAAAMAGVAL